MVVVSTVTATFIAKDAHTSFLIGSCLKPAMKNRSGTTLSLPMPQRALELRSIEADIREALLGTYLCALSIYPDKSSRKNRLHLPLLGEPTGGLSSTLGRALIPQKGLSQTIQNRLQALFPTKRLAVCNISRRKKGDGIQASWVWSNTL